MMPISKINIGDMFIDMMNDPGDLSSPIYEVLEKSEGMVLLRPHFKSGLTRADFWKKTSGRLFSPANKVN